MSKSIVTFDPNGNPILLAMGSARPSRKVERDPSIVLHLPDAPTVKLTPVREVVKRETEKANRATAKLKAAFLSSDDSSSSEQFHFSDPGSTRSPRRKGTPARSLAAAAEHYGMSEAELTTRVVGKAKLEMVDGKLLIRRSDLDRLVADGRLPDPVKRQRVDQMVAEVEGKPTRDAAAETRTDAMAEQIGVDLSQPSKPAATKPTEPSRVPGIAVAKANRKSRRIGAPRRWGEH